MRWRSSRPVHDSNIREDSTSAQFVSRFRAKASKAKQVQSRLKALERMEAVAPVHADSPYRFAFPDPEKMSQPLLSLDNLSDWLRRNPVLRKRQRIAAAGGADRRARRKRGWQIHAAEVPGR